MSGLGTAINVGAVVGGTAVGLLIGDRIPERTRTTCLHGVGLIVLALGMSQVIRTHNIVFPLVAIVVGGVIGEGFRIEDRLESSGDRIRRLMKRDVDVGTEGATGHVEGVGVATDGSPSDGARPSHTTFVEGFVAASLLFCVGPLAILGSISDGLEGDIGLLVVKSALDGLVSIILAATLGWGVGFSVLPLIVYQGALTMAAGSADAVLTERMIIEGTATGGVMVLGISMRLLDLKHVRVGSMLPALAVAPILVALFAR
jgi:uncharacterized membrane protein YqgA involved in biofilm formation